MTEEIERLVRIETKMDQLLEGSKDHETRIRGLEAWKARALGLAAAVGAGASFLAPKLWAILPH